MNRHLYPLQAAVRAISPLATAAGFVTGFTVLIERLALSIGAVLRHRALEAGRAT